MTAAADSRMPVSMRIFAGLALIGFVMAIVARFAGREDWAHGGEALGFFAGIVLTVYGVRKGRSGIAVQDPPGEEARKP
jgi:hypothetical protein